MILPRLIKPNLIKKFGAHLISSQNKLHFRRASNAFSSLNSEFCFFSTSTSDDMYSDVECIYSVRDY